MSTLTTAASPLEVAKSITGKEHISWSQIQTYQQCPVKYRFRYVDHAEPDFTPSSLAFGGAMGSNAAAKKLLRIGFELTGQIRDFCGDIRPKRIQFHLKSHYLLLSRIQPIDRSNLLQKTAFEGIGR